MATPLATFNLLGKISKLNLKLLLKVVQVYRSQKSFCFLNDLIH